MAEAILSLEITLMVRKSRVFATLLWACFMQCAVTLPAWAKDRSPDAPTTESAPPSEFSRRHPFADKLMRPVAVDYPKGTTLASIFDDLSEKSGVPINVDWERLNQDEGIGEDVAIEYDIKWKARPVRHIISYICHAHRLHWSEEPAGVFITTDVQSDTVLTTRVYSVRDVLVADRSPDLSRVRHPYRDQDEAARRRIVAALQKRVSLEYPEGSPFADVFKFLEAKTGEAIDVNWYRLDQDEGMSLDATSNFAVKLIDVTAEQALDRFLKEHRLTWIHDGGAITVTTQVEAETRLNFRCFSGVGLLSEVRKSLLSELSKAAAQRRDEEILDSASRQPAKNIIGATAAIPAPNAAPEKDEYAIDSQSLIDVVRNGTLPRDSWDDQGGPGTIHFFAPALTYCITTTDDVSKQIDALLAELGRQPVDAVWGEGARPARPSGIQPGGGGAPAAMESLIEIIREGTTPRDAWDDQGGQGTITPLPWPLALVVTTTPRSHDQIDEILLQLRRGRWYAMNGTRPWEQDPSAKSP